MSDFLKTDYSENQTMNFEALPTGVYEAIINNAKEDATKSGAETLQIDLLIRNDLDGVPDLNETNAKYHNRHVFVDNWKRKATKQYDMQGFQYILQAARVPEGTPIHTVDDFIQLITGVPVRVYIKQEENTYQGQTTTVNRVAPWNFEETQFPQVQHAYKDSKDKPAAKNNNDPFAGNSIDVSDDDLPF